MQDDAALNGIADTETVELDPDTEVLRLAELDQTAYEGERQKVAKALGWRVSVLDKAVADLRPRKNGGGAGGSVSTETVEEWPHPVDGAAVLDEIVIEIKRFVAIDDASAHAVALWVLFAHTFDAYEISPRLFVTSPEKRCGKTTLLKILLRLAPNPMLLSRMSPAAMVRIIDAEQPTLMLDEADGYVKDSEAFRNLINAGHEIDNCSTAICSGEGASIEAVKLRVWCPFVVAAIGNLQGTIEDRSVTIHMRRRKANEQVEKARRRNLKHLGDLASKAARWGADHVGVLKDMIPDIPDQLNDRAADNWEPLLSVADRAGGRWPQVARTAATVLDNEAAAEDDDSAAVMLLSDCWQVFEDRNLDRILSSRLVAALVELEERPWCEWRRGDPITQNGVARLLKQFAVTSTPLRMDNGDRGRGYYRQSFRDAYERYVLGEKACIPAQTPDSNRATVTNERNLPNIDDSNRDKQGCLSHFESAQKPQSSGECHGCTVENPENGWKGEL